jgi:hypothetical protein
MNKLVKIFLIILVVIIVWGFMRFVIGGPEDDWICVDSGWVKHGAPATPKPETGCGEEVDCESFLVDNCPHQCVVCPPCPECSSIVCQSEQLCQDLGIDRSWYEGIKGRLENDL